MSVSSKRKREKDKVPAFVAPVQVMTNANPTIHTADKVWRLGFNTQNAKGALEELIRSHVIRDALKTKRELKGVDGDEAYAFTDLRVKQKHYVTFAPGWVEILNSPAGGVLYLQSLLLKHQPDATEADAEQLLLAEPEQTAAAIEVVSPDFFKAVAIQQGWRPDQADEFGRTITANIKAMKTQLPDSPATAGPATDSPP